MRRIDYIKLGFAKFFCVFAIIVACFIGYSKKDVESEIILNNLVVPELSEAIKSIMYVCYVVGAVLALLGLFTLIRCIYFSEFFPSLFDRFKVFWNII